MNVPQISVVMPVYNAERYVAEAVESILSQTFTDFEFLIFDDGSKDGSLKILQHYAQIDPRIQVFAKRHQGYVPLLNEGIRKARGKFVARMDADDVSLSQRFTRQVTYLDGHLDCVAVGCDLFHVDQDGDTLCKVIYHREHEIIDANLLQGKFDVICHPASMMRRAALVAFGGYREEYEPIEDFAVWLHLAEHGRLANLPEVLFLYRQHHESVNATQFDRQKELGDRVITEARLRRGLKPLDHSISTFAIPTPIERHQIWAWQSARSGHRRTAFKHAAISLREAPVSFRSWVVLSCSLMPLMLLHLIESILVFTGLRKVFAKP